MVTHSPYHYSHIVFYSALKKIIFFSHISEIPYIQLLGSLKPQKPNKYAMQQVSNFFLGEKCIFFYLVHSHERDSIIFSRLRLVGKNIWKAFRYMRYGAIIFPLHIFFKIASIKNFHFKWGIYRVDDAQNKFAYIFWWVSHDAVKIQLTPDNYQTDHLELFPH